MARVEGGIRILKNKLNIPPHRLQLTGRQGIDTFTVKGDAPFLRLHQPQQRPASGGFATAGLPHQRQRFTGQRSKLTFSTAWTSRFTRLNNPLRRENASPAPDFQNRFTRHHGVLFSFLSTGFTRRYQRKASRQIAAVHCPKTRHRRQQRLV
jgi:hypothetical protein